MTFLDGKSVRRIEVMNQAVPTENPKAVPLMLDFTGDTDLALDLSNEVWRGEIQMIQTIFIDCKGLFGLIVVINDGFQNIVAKPNSQGYYNILCPNPVKITFSSTQAAGNVIPVFLINVPIAGHSWNTV